MNENSDYNSREQQEERDQLKASKGTLFLLGSRIFLLPAVQWCSQKGGALLRLCPQKLHALHTWWMVPVLPTSYVLEIIPPRSEDGNREIIGLETVMQSLVLDSRQPIALEIAGTSTRKRFLLRATTLAALTHAEQQLRLRYPQAQFLPVEKTEDPFQLRESLEAATVAELLPGAPDYLPMRQWDTRQVGTDPLLGVLAALSTVPTEYRAVTQITLLPASPTWSKSHQRKAIEHALEPERVERQDTRAQLRSTNPGPSTAGLIILGLVLVGLIVIQRFKQAIPLWVRQDLTALLHKQIPVLTAEQWLQIIGVLLVIVAVTILIGSIKRRFARPLYDQRLVALRTSRVAYRGRLRLYVIGPVTSTPEPQAQKKRRQTRKAVLASLVAAYRQFDTADAGYFVAHHLSARKGDRLLKEMEHHTRWKLWGSPLPNWARHLGTSRHFFTGDFLSSAWRLPQLADLGELSGVAQKRARTFPIPPALLHEQSRAEWHVPVGTCSHAGTVHRFQLPPGFFCHHTFLGGKSGEGKSTLMVHLVKGVIEEGHRGLFLLDPHGDLAEDVLRVIPEDRLGDVVLVDLGETASCIGFNPLDVTLGRDRDLVVASLISVFSHIWKSGWGPRMEAPFRAAVMTLFEANTTLVQRDPLHGPDQQYTLLDILQVLTDESFCHDLLEMTSDLFLHRFWYEYYSPLSLVQQRDRIDPVLTKMMQFESKIARRILGQSRATIRFHELIRQPKVIIVRLAFAEVGIQTGSLIGSILLGLLMVTLREQSRLAVEERMRMVMFLDEFQTFGAGADLAQLLAELRKYGGSAVLATQSLDYLTAIDPSLLPMILANTKQYFLFRLSAKDAVMMAQELDIAPADLVNLDSHTCYVRLVFAGQQQPTFSVRLDLPLLGPKELITRIGHESQRSYCLPATEIEQRLTNALGRAIAASSNRTSYEKSVPDRVNEANEKEPITSENQHGTHFAKSKKRQKGKITSFDRFPHQMAPTEQGCEEPTLQEEDEDEKEIHEQ